MGSEYEPLEDLAEAVLDGHPVDWASAESSPQHETIRQLKVLAGHLKEGQFVTKFRKTFTKGEMNDDLLLVPAKIDKAEDKSEYEEILPTSPP